MKTPSYIAYSVASASALSWGGNVDEAIANSDWLTKGDTACLVVARLTGSREPLHHLDNLPATAEIVWRGANPLSQRFRAAGKDS